MGAPKSGPPTGSGKNKVLKMSADEPAALDRAETLMTALDAAGARARLVVEPAREAESLVVIGYEGAP